MYTAVMIIPDGFAQFAMHFEGSLPYGAVCTLGCENPTDMNISDAAAAFAAALSSADVMHNVASSITLTTIDVKFGPNDTGPSGSATVDINGEDTSDPASPNTSFLFKKYTALGGRHGRGRMFWPGVTEPAVRDNGAIEPATIAAVQAQLDDLVVALATVGLPAVLLHNDLTAPTELTNMVVDARAATQRRRLRR